jgi:hypothetical protein
MAITVTTSTPRKLLADVRSAIKSGGVTAWSVDADGDFTHTSDALVRKAWFRPRLLDDRVVFRILTPRGTTMSKTTYGAYHGKFVQMLLTKFDAEFEAVSASALATPEDVVKA